MTNCKIISVRTLVCVTHKQGNGEDILHRKQYTIKNYLGGTSYILFKSQGFNCISFYVRNYSSIKVCVSSPPAVLVAVKTYNNTSLDKLLILKDNKGKAGVYR